MAQVIELRTADDAEAMLAASHERPVALLKHSSMCFASARGRAAFERLEATDDALPLYERNGFSRGDMTGMFQVLLPADDG